MIRSLARKAAILVSGLAIAALALVGGGGVRQQPVAEAQLLEPCFVDFFICITIAKVAPDDPGEEFVFSGNVEGPFSLTHDHSRSISFFQDGFGFITIAERAEPGWELVDIECYSTTQITTDDLYDVDLEDQSVTVHFDRFEGGQRHMNCIFYNEQTGDDEDDEDERDDGGRFIGGGVFAGVDTAERNRARANAAGAAAAAAVAPAPMPATTVRPPSTGDAGLR